MLQSWEEGKSLMQTRALCIGQTEERKHTGRGSDVDRGVEKVCSGRGGLEGLAERGGEMPAGQFYVQI